MIAVRRRAGGPGAPRLSPRWVSLLDSFGWGARLAAARTEGGRIVSLDLSRGEAFAEVRTGSKEKNDVRIRVEKLPARLFDRALGAVAARASLAASLLSGRIAAEVEAAFASTGRALFPAKADELSVTCTCGRTPAPCPHAAAVLLRIGELLDGDPFLLFLLRGREREEVLATLRQHRALPASGTAGAPLAGPRKGVEPAEPLPANALEKPELFFRPLLPAAALRTTFAPPEHPEAVLTRLGPAPLADPDAARLLVELHRAIGMGAAERLAEWEWRRAGGRGRTETP